MESYGSNGADADGEETERMVGDWLWGAGGTARRPDIHHPSRSQRLGGALRQGSMPAHAPTCASMFRVTKSTSFLGHP